MQIDAPFANRAGKLAAVGVHWRIVGVVVGQTQVINLIRELIHFQDNAVIVDLSHRREARDIVGNRATGGNQAWVIHIRQTGVSAFQQRRGGSNVLIAP